MCREKKEFMAIKVSQLNAPKRMVEVTFGEEKMNVTYRPSCVTPQFLDDLQQPKQGEAITDAVQALVVEWDLLNEQGRKLPPTSAVIRKLPLSFLMAVIKAITEDTEVPKAPLETSADG
jgi:hypothetical protein